MMRPFNKFRSIRKGFISPNIIFSAVGYILLGSNVDFCVSKKEDNYLATEPAPSTGSPSNLFKGTQPSSSKEASGVPVKESVSPYSISLVYDGTIGLIKMQQGQSDKGFLFLLSPDLILRFTKVYQQGEDTYDSFIETIRFIEVDGPFLDKLSKEAGIWPYGNNKALQSVMSSLRRYTDRDYGIDSSTKVIQEVNKDSVTLKCNVNSEKIPSGVTVAFVLVKNSENISFVKNILENPAQYTGKKEVLERDYQICLASVGKDTLVFNGKNSKQISKGCKTVYLYVKGENGNHASLIPLGNVQVKNNIAPSIKANTPFYRVNSNISPQGNKRPLDDNMDNKSNPDSTSSEGTPPEDPQPTGSIGNQGPIIVGSSNSTQNDEENEPDFTSTEDFSPPLPPSNEGGEVLQPENNPMDLTTSFEKLPFQQGSQNMSGSHRASMPVSVASPSIPSTAIEAAIPAQQNSERSKRLHGKAAPTLDLSSQSGLPTSSDKCRLKDIGSADIRVLKDHKEEFIIALAAHLEAGGSTCTNDDNDPDGDNGNNPIDDDNDPDDGASSEGDEWYLSDDSADEEASSSLPPQLTN